ncbi:DNA/RNA non-specific endonuclease [Oleiharenicola lentus]|uniref:DNA/RNA non-specific endonuclease n=1 Tax=Oleiharenicola lentus TaxID=2508720 RepID=A0A4Q1C771_9BACT|nr:DNA/RNA non-specific endonuclease [Oleiharenicola lentus]RXK54743.1 DNA/RNA non-specific endonuclease [Oleiharenicola lentus]
MARKSTASRSPKIPGALRRTKAFLVVNLVLWGAIGGWFLFQPAARQQEVARLVGNAFDGRKQVTAFDVAWDLWQLYAGEDYVAAVAPGDKVHLYGGVPHLRPDLAPVRVLANLGYVAGYSDTLGNPLWAAYRLHDIEPSATPERPDEFSLDLRTSARIEPGDYARSGYDRGHLAPNFAIASRYGAAAQRETFLMSNIIPQKHALNAGLWKQLEQRIANSYPARFGEVWVIAGPVFGPKPEKLRRRVAVPESCFMIIVDESDGRVRATAYLFPQDTPEGGRLDDFLVSIDELEHRTGLDFLPELPDAAEDVLEARRAERAW